MFLLSEVPLYSIRLGGAIKIAMPQLIWHPFQKSTARGLLRLRATVSKVYSHSNGTTFVREKDTRKDSWKQCGTDGPRPGRHLPARHQQPEVNYLPRFGPQLISLEE